MTSQDNPRPLNKTHYALAIGSQSYCMGGAGIYTAPSMAGPWSFQGSLYNQMVPEPKVRMHRGRCLAQLAPEYLAIDKTASLQGPAPTMADEWPCACACIVTAG